VERRPEAVVLRFDDDGVPFDPSSGIDPAPAKSLEEARIGGFGLILVRRAASALDYTRTPDGRNRVTVTLRCASI
jgi:serine/threonine-protein kinase RsbW